MQVVLKVWSSNPDHNGACEFALVEITPDFAKLALRRVAVLREQKTLDPAVEETSCWDSAPQFFSPWADPGTQTDEVKAACLKLAEELDSLQIDRREMAFTAVDFSVPQTLTARVECTRMIVREEGIAFTAIPKHTDVPLMTAEISIQDLDSLIKELSSSGRPTMPAGEPQHQGREHDAGD